MWIPGSRRREKQHDAAPIAYAGRTESETRTKLLCEAAAVSGMGRRRNRRTRLAMFTQMSGVFGGVPRHGDWDHIVDRGVGVLTYNPRACFAICYTLRPCNLNMDFISTLTMLLAKNDFSHAIQ